VSKIIAAGAIRGARAYVARAEAELSRAREKHGDDCPVSLTDSAYYLPVIYALTGTKARRLGDLEPVVADARRLLPEVPSEHLWLPYLGGALDAGIATLFAQEILEVLKIVEGRSLREGIWLGPTSDAILREQGIKLVDGRMPGFAACVGALPTVEAAVQLARDLQERNILVFMAGHTNGVSMAEQLAEAGVEMNWDTFLVPYGKDVSAAVHALGFAARAAMTFGGISPKGKLEARKVLEYTLKRVHAFVLALGEVDDEKYATAAGAISFGFPTLADTPIPQILPSGICRYEHVVSSVGHEEMPAKAMEVRGLKLKMDKIPIPVRYGPAFEGERVRKEDVAAEFGGKYAPAFEYLQMAEMGEVEDGRIEVLGPDLDELEDGAQCPLAILVRVAGRKMQKDFESILERHIHTFLSMPMGVMHLGQRDVIWVRVGKDAKEAGFRLTHVGTILRAKLLSEFPAIVDKVEVTLLVRREDVEARMAEARAAYEERDQRLVEMTDESVDTFYSCQLCQSYAPNHVCVITPERLGLCGAYNWLDGKAAFEINPHGANQPVKKGRCLDPERGKWQGVNDFVYERSNRTIAGFSAYSMMDDPMTSCGCFECIACVLPGTNGIMLVDREFAGVTPSGMTFSSLAETVGGGQQTPGFIGIGTLYIVSRKFITADGGLTRVVWMTRHIKDRLGERLVERAREVGAPDLLEKIADESVATELEPLIEYLNEIQHPALALPDMF